MNRVVEEIIACRNWRVRELELLKKLKVTTLYSLDERTNEQYLKMCIPYIYAHWEGFIVESFRLVIDYINAKEIKENEIINELYVFSNQTVFKKLSGKQSFEQCCEFSEKVINNLNKPVYIDINLLSTKSNLKFEQLCDIFSWFKLDITECKQLQN
ncbi:hypothetical protein EHE19_002180 [Ruminiclostridium herbifermentans]|uniref:RiboL-PSP-HEPN domain-containing protein n=1 Tax=Ruminiclostridium herbifermentans TaxID=2488810 RepID=A0A4U7JF24_9FIRM|nr:MAE_28990/MAE_18760 family HEPN-like nuclease [Ruminiclostridium herbifermentans]QNU67371.1 hypothetical protein EHE19_002180 [Ruminiclostridium herbifermentans]